MSLKPYPEYKDSGVEWLGTVPKHWRTEALKRSTYLKARVGWKGLTSDEFLEESDAYLVTGTDFKQKYIEWSRCYQVSKERYDDDPFIQLKNGDLLMTKDGTIGKLALVSGLDKPACLNSGIFVLRPRQCYSTDFLYWVFSSEVFKKFVDLTSYGSTIMHLYQNVLENFIFGVPTQQEQARIARFLEEETAEIDAFIADQEELIELLSERRTATITRAVTKGLDANAPMKDSGVEWLGEVPTSWVVAPVKRQLLGIDQGVSPEASTELADDQSVGVLKAGCVNGGTFQETQHKRLPEGFAYDSKILVNVGDLLVNRASGSPGLVGSAAIVRTGNYKLILSDKIFRLRLSSTVLPNYMEKFLNSTVYRIQVLGAISGAEGLANNLPSSALRRFLVPVPPVDEQEKITVYLDRETADIDAAMADAREAIALSKERRAAVISAAVTGKIDVRGLIGPATSGTEGASVGAA